MSAGNGPNAKFKDGYREGNKVYNGMGDLQHCQGDCDSDWDCAWGHVCVQREGFEPMAEYGCLGAGTMYEDYCVYGEYISKSITGGLPPAVMWRNDGEHKRLGGDGSDYTLGKCEGDCDSDDDCAKGLVCFFRDATDSPSVADADRVFPIDAPLQFTTNSGKKVGCSLNGENDVDYCVPENWLSGLAKASGK